MKFVLFVIAAFAAIQSINCFIDDDSEEFDQFKQLKERVRQQATIVEMRNKVDAICPGYGSRVMNITSEIQTCALLIDEEKETLCSIAENEAPKCLNPIINMFEECLPAQSKKLPSMLQKMIVAVTKHLCRSDGEHIFELTNGCIKYTNPKTQRCIRRFMAKVQDHKRRNRFPSAQDVCEMLESFKPCVQSHLNSACGHYITRESFLGVYDQVLSVCKTYEMNEIEVLEPSVQ